MSNDNIKGENSATTTDNVTVGDGTIDTGVINGLAKAESRKQQDSVIMNNRKTAIFNYFVIYMTADDISLLLMK